MQMKISLFVLSLLASSTCVYAVERPDGTLGTNMIYAGVRYQTIRAFGTNYNYAGPALYINQNLHSGSSYGIDAGFDVSHASNTNKTGQLDYDDYLYELNATIYRKGVVAPYLSASGSFGKFTAHYTDGTIYDDTSTTLSVSVGAECHLLSGWSVTPYLSYIVNTENEWGDGTTYVGIKTDYWITSRIGVSAGTSYYTKYDADSCLANIGLTYHY
jgi:hypothetical protein